MLILVSLNGQAITSFESFVAEFNRAYRVAFGESAWYGEHVDWNGELLDLENFLEAPDEEFEFVWRDSSRSQGHLGYAAMVTYWEECHAECLRRFPAVNVLLEGYLEKIEIAKKGSGPTLFDHLVDQLTGPTREIRVQFE